MKSLSKIKKKLKQGKGKSKKRKKRVEKVVRVLYPWLKRPTSRKAKAFMAYLIDTSGKAHKLTGKKRKAYFLKHIYDTVLERYPKLFMFVKRYYKERGKALTKKHFTELLYARLMNMYEGDFTCRSKEHPLNSDNTKLRADYQRYSV